MWWCESIVSGKLEKLTQKDDLSPGVQASLGNIVNLYLEEEEEEGGCRRMRGRRRRKKRKEGRRKRRGREKEEKV